MNGNKRYAFGAWLVALVCLLAACQSGGPKNNQSKAYDENLVAALVHKGQAAFDKGQLTSPQNDSALYYFRKAILLAPEYPDARSGLESIFDYYLKLAKTAQTNADFKRALSFLDQAEQVLLPTKISKALRVEILEEQKTAANANKTIKPIKIKAAEIDGIEYLLSIDGLNNKDKKIRERLRLIAEHTRSLKGSVRIEARDAAEGRWIHDQLKKAVPAFKLQADIRNSLYPKVVVLRPH